VGGGGSGVSRRREGGWGGRGWWVEGGGGLHERHHLEVALAVREVGDEVVHLEAEACCAASQRRARGGGAVLGGGVLASAVRVLGSGKSVLGRLRTQKAESIDMVARSALTPYGTAAPGCGRRGG